MDNKEKIFYWLFLLFWITLFLPPVMPVVNNAVTAGIILYCLFGSSITDKLQLLRKRKEIWFMILFFILQLISAAISSNQGRAWSIIGMRSPLLIFPVSIGLTAVRRAIKLHMLSGYAIIITGAAFCCFIDAGYRAWINRDMQWLYDDSLTILIGRTSVYMSLLVLTAIFSYIRVLESGFVAGKDKGFIYACITFLLLFHFLLASRISLITLYSSIIGYVVWKMWAKPQQVILSLVGTAMLAVTLLLLFPKTFNRFRQFQYTSFNYNSRNIESHYNMSVTPEQWNGINFRLAVWNCGLAIANRHLMSGVPLGDKQAYFMDEYKARGFVFAYNKHRNLHNTWLDVLVNTGIPGLILFTLAYLAVPMATAVKTQNWFNVLVVIAFAMALFTETWTDGSFGCIVLGFWSSLLSLSQSGHTNCRGAGFPEGREVARLPRSPSKTKYLGH